MTSHVLRLERVTGILDLMLKTIFFAGATGGATRDMPFTGTDDSPAFCGGTNMHNNVIMCRYCKIPNHFVWKCRKFAALSAEEQIKFVDAERLCNGCLKPGHVLADCWRKVQCDVNGCKQLHSFLLHSDALVKK